MLIWGKNMCFTSLGATFSFPWTTEKNRVKKFIFVKARYRAHSSFHSFIYALTFVLIAGFLSTACVRYPFASIPHSNWELKAKGSTIDYYVLYGSEPVVPPELALDRLEAFTDEIKSYWHVPDRLSYYVMPGRKKLFSWSGNNITGYPVGGKSVVSVHASDVHELAHILTTPSSRPLRLAKFWREAIAMYYTWPEFYQLNRTLTDPIRLGWWHDCSVHASAQSLLNKSKLPLLADMIYDNNVWDSVDFDISYPTAGSFLTFLLGPNHQNPKRILQLRAFFSDANIATTKTDVLHSFERNFGVSITKAEADWRDFLLEWDEASLKR